MDPNVVFRQCFDWFVVKYRHTSAEDAKPFVRQWLPIGTPQWDLKYSVHASSMALYSQASLDIQSLTKTPLTLASTYSITGSSLPKNIRRRFSAAMTPPKPITSQISSHSGKMQSKLQYLPQSLQASTDMAWPQLTMTQNPSQMRCKTSARPMPPPKNH